MRVVKYFYEEPASLEVLPPTDAPFGRRPAASKSLASFRTEAPCFRGYVGGSDLENGRTGASCVLDHWSGPLVGLLDSAECHRFRGGASIKTGLAEAVAEGESGDVIAVHASSSNAWHPASDERDRTYLGTLATLLSPEGAFLLAEPAPDGVDWTVLSGRPVAEALRNAFRSEPSTAARFVIPQIRARGEHRFYFERYDLGLFEEFRVRS